MSGPEKLSLAKRYWVWRSDYLFTYLFIRLLDDETLPSHWRI